MNKLTAMRATRRQADLISVKALAELLRQVVDKPGEYVHDAGLQAALSSQGALAKHSAPTASIHAMSLNHQRLVADLALGSYDTLDALRRAARDALSDARARAKRGNTKTKDGLRARVNELEAEVMLLKQDLALVHRAYDLRCIQARTYAAAASAATQTLCAKEQRELDASFSLRRKPVDRSNVVPFEEARSRVRPNE